MQNSPKALAKALKERDRLKQRLIALNDEIARLEAWRGETVMAATIKVALESALSAYEALLEWQPIETAPRDGTWVLVVVHGDWKPGVPFIPCIVRWGECPLAKENGWLFPDACHGTDTQIVASFTHWMPLPEPPAALNKEGE